MLRGQEEADANEHNEESEQANQQFLPRFHRAGGMIRNAVQLAQTARIIDRNLVSDRPSTIDLGDGLEQ